LQSVVTAVTIQILPINVLRLFGYLPMQLGVAVPDMDLFVTFSYW
jgi:hypothetical protein